MVVVAGERFASISRFVRIQEYVQNRGSIFVTISTSPTAAAAALNEQQQFKHLIVSRIKVARPYTATI